MRATVSVNGRFHLFDTALQLQKYSHLDTLITSYPARLTSERWGIKKEKISSLSYIEVTKRLAAAILPSRLSQGCVNRLQKYMFSRLQVTHISSDISHYIGFTSNQIHAFEKCRKHGIKCISDEGSAHPYTIQDAYRREELEHNIQLRTMTPWMIRNLLKEYEYSDYILVPSNYVKQSLSNHGIDDHKIKVIPLGVDLSKYRSSEVDSKKPAFRAVFAGGVSLEKGAHKLYKAIQKLDNKDIFLSFAGNMTPSFRTFLGREQSIPSNIEFLGHLTSKQLSNLFSKSSVLVLPSLSDGFGLVVTQAMACRLPVVVSSTTGAADLVKDSINGYTLRDNGIDELSELLLFLYKDSSHLDCLSRGAYETSLDIGGWDSYGCQLVEFLKSIDD